MPTIRLATAPDAGLLAEQRVLMFVDAGVAEEFATGPMRENFIAWVRERLADGRYIGWIVEEHGHAGGGVYGSWTGRRCFRTPSRSAAMC